VFFNLEVSMPKSNKNVRTKEMSPKAMKKTKGGLAVLKGGDLAGRKAVEKI
jgi:hypothetical protein